MLYLSSRLCCNDKMKKTLLFLLVAMAFFPGTTNAQSVSSSGSVGIQGTISAPPPALAPLISIPTSNTTFTVLPVTTSGICDSDLLVKLFKNGVFAGSAVCQGGSFSMSIDLFNGRNDLVARQYDQLDQESPPSPVVSVLYVDSNQSASVNERVTLTSNFAKRGANPGQKLSWPVAISGGTGPYAITVDWGDGGTTLLSVPFPGEFTIEYTYKNPGSYAVVVKGVDVNQQTAYLQIVAIGNGALSQEGGTVGADIGSGAQQVRVVWQPAAILVPFLLVTFWLGRRYAVFRIRKQIEQGERPFA